jgi:glutathione synthase/RimK-type ligase-like ATP-grasp enzyme
VVSADEYLEGRADAIAADLVVVNLCRSYQYLSKGYYVSLLADARHQRAFPTLKMVEELRNPATYLRILQEAGIEAADPRDVREWRRAATKVAVGSAGDALAEASPGAQVALLTLPATTNGRGNGNGHGNGNGNGHGNGNGGAHAGAGSTASATSTATDETRPFTEAWCVFGKTADERFRRHCAAVFKTYSLPLMKIRFYRDDDLWKVGQLVPGNLTQLEPAEAELLTRELGRPQFVSPRRSTNGPRPYRLACLWDDADPLAASDRETLDRMARIAARRGLLMERIGREDLSRLGEYDALFIRSVTAIDHYSFTFAQAAETLGIPVIDDPQSIIKCSNKVYLQELFRRNGIATPRTVTISRKTPPEEVLALGFPLIVKLPDGTFSQAVKKAENAAEFEAITQDMFKRSPLLIVQEFIPTAFDWRIGILEGHVLFACKYHMARGHWQIVSLTRRGEHAYGKVEAVRLEDVPRNVIDLALEGTALLGNGLFGVDVKETPAGPVVIEINDNPNIETGCEDGVEKDRVYEAILDAFVSRIRSQATSEERT